MLITRTPLRISFFGGGTDFRGFYKNNYGAVLGMAIDKYVYVLSNKRFESNVRASYSRTEIVPNSSKIEHELIRESLLQMGVRSGIEIVTIADVPGSGSGLGSSSSTLVGLLTNISHFTHAPNERNKIAELACEIEINKLGSPIGKQDQYFASFGGFRYIRFNSDESVKVENIDMSTNTINDLEDSILCFFTGLGRNSKKILATQKKMITTNENILYEIRNMADTAKDILKDGDLTKFGEMLNEGWKLKKKLSSGISNELIDHYYKLAIEAGAIGGKISGAGGGGFLTFYCEKKNQVKVKESLKNLQELKIGIDKVGTSLIFPSKNN